MAVVKIDLDRRLGSIDRKAYGMFIEHLGRCVYGGIYEPGSPLSDSNGFRKDVLETAKALHPPILRWPGGNFVSGYHWLDGVGPKDKRPVRPELAWNAIETNQFGTNEFIRYCRALGTEPYICANLGTGTMDEAAAWVEYCNGDRGTSYAALRAEHGFQQPHRVTYWGLGNEMYGFWQIGQRTAQDYAKLARECAKVMKATDSRIKLVLCGGQDLDWDREVLGKCADVVDYISYHFYWGPTPGQDAHYSTLARPYRSEQYLRFLWQLIEQVRRERAVSHPIRIAVDEWNVWFRTMNNDNRLEERYNLTDALAVAIYLNMMRRNCNSIGIANLAQMVNVIAPIFTSPEGVFLQTIYHPLRLAAERSGSIALDTYVGCACYPADYAGVAATPYLDALATLDEGAGKLFLSLVNLNKDETEKVEIVLQNAKVSSGVAHLVSGDTPEVENDFGKERVTHRIQPVEAGGERFDYSMSPLTHAVLELELIR